MNVLTGSLVMTLSALFYGLFAPYLKKVSEAVPPFMTLALTSGIIAVTAFVLSLIFERGFDPGILTSKSMIKLIIAVGLLNLLAYWFEILGFQYLPVWQQQIFFALIPAFAGVAAFFILGEALSMKLVYGLIITGIGLYVSVR